MKRRLRILLLSILLTPAAVSTAQDIPLFSQKLTNSFMYNPAMAGNGMGSMTVSWRRNYANVPGSPENYFISLHTPIANQHYGVGANIYQEDVNFIRTLYASTAFAYHIHFNRWNVLSMGVSGEYNTVGLNGATNSNPGDDELQRLRQGKSKNYDFSFGLNYQTKFFKAGISVNRLATAWIRDDSKNILSNYYSGYLQGMIPLRGGEDKLEPYIAFRKFSEISDAYDVGLYYTYNKRIMVGAATRRGSVVNATAGFHLSKYIMLGYSREIIFGSVGGSIGSANEITLRFDFNNSEYKERFREDYKSALSYRKKTLSTAGKNPSQLHRKQKKLAPFSPNARYQNIKKLSTKTKSLPQKKKGFKGKKRKKAVHKKSTTKRKK